MTDINDKIKTAWIRQLNEDWKMANFLYFEDSMRPPNYELSYSGVALGRWKGGCHRRLSISIESAKEIVSAIKQNEIVNIDYYTEPEQNISLARNKAVQNAKGNLIAFIDDDEFPEDKWLLSLFNAYKSFNVTGVLGPVLSNFEEPPPNWIKKGNYFFKKSFKTGVILNWNDTRTSNLLIVRDIFNEGENRFDESFGRTGGEDTDFFKRLIEKGYRFAWCNEAVVYETVPPERWKIRWLLLREWK